MKEFLGAFDLAHDVLLLPIYAASEQPISGISSETVRDGMIARGHRSVQTCEDFEYAKATATHALEKGHMVILMGAGSIGALAADMRVDAERRTV